MGFALQLTSVFRGCVAVTVEIFLRTTLKLQFGL